MVSLETTPKLVKHHWPLLVLAAAICAAFFPIFLGQFYSTGDMRTIHIPLETFFQNELRAGRLPAWNPNIAWGYPVIASSQIGFFYPPLLISRLLLPLTIYFPLIFLGHILATAIATYFFFRANKLSTQAAILGSLAFSIGAFFVQHTTQFNIILTAAYLPWQLFMAHKLSQSRKPQAWHILVFILLLSLPFLAGQLQIPAFMAAFSSIFFFINSFQKHKNLATPAIVLLLVTLAVIPLTAVQTLPTLELLQYSSRGSQGDYDLNRANQHSFPIYHLPTLIFPKFFGSDDSYWGKRLEIEYGIFIGIIPFLLAIFSIRLIWKNKTGRFWIWTTLITFLLALGNFSPFRLIGIEPSLWIFSAPARWLLFTTFGLAILAAYGLDNIKIKSFTRWLKIFSIAIILSVILLNLLIFFQSNIIRPILLNLAGSYSEYYIEKIDSLIASLQTSSASLSSPFTLLTLAVLFIATFPPKKISYKKLVVTLTAIELVVIAANTSPAVPWSEVLTPPATLAALPDGVKQKQARLHSLRDGGDTGALLTNPESRTLQGNRHQIEHLLAPNISAQFDIPGTEWPASLSLAANRDIEDLKNIGALTIPASLDQPPNQQPYATINDINIYNLPHEPRASIISNTRETIPQSSTAYKSISPSHTQILISSPQEGTLVIQDTWYPDWIATIDGQPTPVSLNENQFINIPVPAGNHQIDIMFTSKSIQDGAKISLATLLVLTLATTSHYFKRRLTFKS